MSHVMNNMVDKIKNDFSNCTTVLCESAPITDIPTEATYLYRVEATTVPLTRVVQLEAHKSDHKAKNKRVRWLLIPPISFVFIIISLALLYLLRKTRNNDQGT
ncbi:uncharacterized protein O3C94_013844 [Discoglossus pictus]